MRQVEYLILNSVQVTWQRSANTVLQSWIPVTDTEPASGFLCSFMHTLTAEVGKSLMLQMEAAELTGADAPAIRASLPIDIPLSRE